MIKMMADRAKSVSELVIRDSTPGGTRQSIIKPVQKLAPQKPPNTRKWSPKLGLKYQAKISMKKELEELEELLFFEENIEIAAEMMKH